MAIEIGPLRQGARVSRGFSFYNRKRLYSLVLLAIILFGPRNLTFERRNYHTFLSFLLIFTFVKCDLALRLKCKYVEDENYEKISEPLQVSKKDVIASFDRL